MCFRGEVVLCWQQGIVHFSKNLPHPSDVVIFVGFVNLSLASGHELKLNEDILLDVHVGGKTRSKRRV